MVSFAVATAEAKEFVSSDVYPAGFPTVQAVAHMDKLLRERTGGRHSISVLGQEDRDSENFTVGQVRNGTLDMARVNLSVLNYIVPSTAIPSLPYLFKSTTQMLWRPPVRSRSSLSMCATACTVGKSAG